MKKNMGTADRIGRMVLALLFVALYFSGVITGVLGWVLIGLSAIFALTSLVSFCPLYAPFGFSTCKLEGK